MGALVLVRHGETAWNAERRCMGTMPIPLNADGEAQVSRLALALRRYAPARVVSSPMVRTTQTAALIARALGAEVHTDDRLRERDMAPWEGQLYADLANDPAVRETLMNGTATPRGIESMADVVARVCDFVETEWTEDRTLIAVTHGDVVRGAVASLLGMNLDYTMRIAVDPASATRFVRLRWGPTLRSVNWRPSASQENG